MPIPFVQDTFSGNLPINWYPEEDQQKKVVLRQRPGLTDLGVQNTATGGIAPFAKNVRFMQVFKGVSNSSVPPSISADTMFAAEGYNMWRFLTYDDPDPDFIGWVAGVWGDGVYQNPNTAAENGNEIMFVEADHCYIYNKVTNVFTNFTATLPFRPGSVTFQDGYFILSERGFGRFYVSALNDAFTWDPADVATAESSPDAIIRVISHNQNLWVFGESTREIYYNSGDVFPFTRVSGGVFPEGLGAFMSVAQVDSNLVWFSDKKQVRISQGGGSKIISTRKIERLWNNYENPSWTYALSYVVNGHWFYHLTFPTAGKTFVYDHATGLWHEQGYLYDDADHADADVALLGVNKHLPLSYAYFNGHHLVSDWRDNGTIYEMDTDVFTDAGREIVRELDTLTYEDDGNLVNIPEIRVEFAETGDVPVTGQGSEPQCMLKISRNGGKTWSYEKWADMGQIGEYDKRIMWLSNGSGRHCVIRLRVTEPIRTTITDLIVRIEKEK